MRLRKKKRRKVEGRRRAEKSNSAHRRCRSLFLSNALAFTPRSLLALCSRHSFVSIEGKISMSSRDLSFEPRFFETASESTDGENLVIAALASPSTSFLAWSKEKKETSCRSFLPRTPTVDELLLFQTGAPELVVQYGALWWEEGRSCWCVEREREREVEQKKGETTMQGRASRKRAVDGVPVSLFALSFMRARFIAECPHGGSFCPPGTGRRWCRGGHAREAKGGRFPFPMLASCIEGLLRSLSPPPPRLVVASSFSSSYLVRVHVGRR